MEDLLRDISQDNENQLSDSLSDVKVDPHFSSCLREATAYTGLPLVFKSLWAE
jgi:hypothetical protein